MSNFTSEVGKIVIAVAVGLLIEIIGFMLFDINLENTDSTVRTIMFTSGLVTGFVYFRWLDKDED